MSEVTCVSSSNPMLQLSVARDFAASASSAQCSIVAFGSTEFLRLQSPDATLSGAIEIFDSDGTRTDIQESARTGAAAVANSTHLLVAGGTTSTTKQNYLSTIAVYSCARRQRVGLLNLIEPRAFLSGMTTSDGLLSMFAGGISRRGYEATVDVLEHPTGDMSVVDMSEPRRSPSIGGIRQFVVIAGGDGNNGTSRAVDVYDVSIRSMTQTLTLSAPRMNMGVTRSSSQLIMAGGESRTDSAQPNTLDTVTADVVIFVTSGGIVTMSESIGALSVARSRIAAATVGSSAVFVGGITKDLTPVAAIDVFDGFVWWTLANIGPIANAQKIHSVGDTVNFVGIASASSTIAMRSIECRYKAISKIAGSMPTDEPEPERGAIGTALTTLSSTPTTTSSTTTTTNFLDASSSGNPISVPLIVGVVLGGIVVVVALIVAIECALRRRRRRQRQAAAAIEIHQERLDHSPRDPMPEIALLAPQEQDPRVRPSYLNPDDAVDNRSFPKPSTDYGTIPAMSEATDLY
jgi:hypothetical protein